MFAWTCELLTYKLGKLRTNAQKIKNFRKTFGLSAEKCGDFAWANFPREINLYDDD